MQLVNFNFSNNYSREQELMLINQLNAELEACRVELEQEKLQGRDWENQLALANEELERMAVQLDETGQRLDDAHNEVLACVQHVCSTSPIIHS